MFICCEMRFREEHRLDDGTYAVTLEAHALPPGTQLLGVRALFATGEVTFQFPRKTRFEEGDVVYGRIKEKHD